jgi:flotillin
MDDILGPNAVFIMVMVGMLLVGLLVIGIIFGTLYQRATKEVSFVRTGLGGEKIIKDGGSVVLPVVHEIIKVNMNTLRIEVSKTKQEALITKDRMRVDVKADFYLRVKPDDEGIATAAQTLGKRTMNVEEVRTLMESKFVDVLRSVAAEMTMTEMHEQRSDFVQKVQQNATHDLKKNGMELESVSLTGFDQTDLEYFNENNAFDAEGRARLARIIESKKKETNDIEQENRILVEQRNLDAEKQSLDIKQQKETAKLNQQQAIEFKRVEQKALIVAETEKREQEEQVAEISKLRAVESAEIEKSRTIESAEIEKSKEIESMTIEKNKTIAQAKIQQQRDIEVSEQEKRIAIAQKSEEESAARAKAADAEKEKVEKEESVLTVQALAQANRCKDIEVIDAKKVAERDAVGIVVKAQSEKQAATDRAEAVMIEAKSIADAKVLQATADEKVLSVEANGKQALNDAENSLSDAQIDLKRDLAKIAILPQIIENAVKPLEKIEGIKILQGYGGNSGSSTSVGTGNASGGLAEQITEAALSYKAHSPLVDNMLAEVGLIKPGQSLTDLVTGNSESPTNASLERPVESKIEVAKQSSEISDEARLLSATSSETSSD